MATARQIAANRANAAKSSGPKTPAGKARSAQNAKRYPPLSTIRPEDQPRIEQMARHLIEAVGGDIADATSVAEAEVLVARMELDRLALFRKICSPMGATGPLPNLDKLYQRERKARQRARRRLRCMIEAKDKRGTK
jgi:hypothetical protein